MYCAVAVRIEAAKPITTRLTLTRNIDPRSYQVSMLAEISDRMKAIARVASGKNAFILPFSDLLLCV